MAAPRGADGKFAEKVHSRLGFVADASGEIKVRAHLCTQRPRVLSTGAKKGMAALRGTFGKGTALGAGSESVPVDALDVDDDVENAAPVGVAGDPWMKDDAAVEDVVARARARIAEARAQGRLHPNAAVRATLAPRGPDGGERVSRASAASAVSEASADSTSADAPSGRSESTTPTATNLQ